MIGECRAQEALKLCRALGKVRDQHKLIFFDFEARVHFIVLKLPTQLGIHSEEMGNVHEDSLVVPKYSFAITPIVGKL